MLKAVENPNNGELTQGVMVTPEGGYVVAQPDLYVYLAISVFFWVTDDFGWPGLHGKNKFHDRKA